MFFLIPQDNLQRLTANVGEKGPEIVGQPGRLRRHS